MEKWWKTGGEKNARNSNAIQNADLDDIINDGGKLISSGGCKAQDGGPFCKVIHHFSTSFSNRENALLWLITKRN